MKKIINIIGSVKFAFIITVLILFLSFLGSIISEASVDNLKNNAFISLFFDPATNGFRNFASSTGLLKIYTTPLFIALLILFTLSLTVCSIRLLPFARKGFSDLSESSLSENQNVNLTKSDFITFFKKNRWKISYLKDSEIIKAEKHILGRYGVLVTHLGVFLVMLGAVIGYYFGFSDLLVLYENQKVNGLETKNKEFIPFGFDIKLNKFVVDYYEGTKTAKAFTSYLSVFDKGTEEKVELNVNHPLKKNGMVFYQASYGMSAHSDMDIVVSYASDNESKIVTLKYGKPYDTGKYILLVTNYMNNWSMSDNGSAVDLSYEMKNPAVYITVFNQNGDKLVGGWLLLYAYEPTYVSYIDMSFKFENLENLQYSGISVKYNPGIAVVYIGGILMCIGVLLIYFLNYTAVFFKADDGKIIYKVRSQRKYFIVNPANKFKKFINADTKI